MSVYVPNSLHFPTLLNLSPSHDQLQYAAVSVLALVSASLVLASNPALAFKGGGPYGSEVTRGQDLTGKDFSGKTLIEQDFKTSILRQANFKGAKLLGASFLDADLTDFTDVRLRDDQRMYLCKIADGVNSVTGSDTKDTLFCK